MNSNEVRLPFLINFIVYFYRFLFFLSSTAYVCLIYVDRCSPTWPFLLLIRNQTERMLQTFQSSFSESLGNLSSGSRCSGLRNPLWETAENSTGTKKGKYS